MHKEDSPEPPLLTLNPYAISPLFHHKEQDKLQILNNTGNNWPTLKILLASLYADKMYYICLILPLQLSYSLTDGVIHQILSVNCFLLCSVHITSANMSDSQLLNFPS